MPVTKRKTRQCTLNGGTPSDLPITDLTTYSDVARYFYKLREREDVKDKNIIIQRTLNSLRGTWLNCNPKLVLALIYIPTPLFLFLIMIGNFILIKNRIKT